MTVTDASPQETIVHVLWIDAGPGGDSDPTALAGAQRSIEDLVLGALPGLAGVALDVALADLGAGRSGAAADLPDWVAEAEHGGLDPYVLVVEGSVPDRSSRWSRPGGDGQGEAWLDRLARGAWAVLAAGTCACYGGVRGAAGSPGGAFGVPDYLGESWRSRAGIPVVCVPGSPARPEHLSETVRYLLYQAVGQAPMIPLDDAQRPQWLFGATVPGGPEQAAPCGHDEADAGGRGSERAPGRCVAKLGSSLPVLKCGVGGRARPSGPGGCPNAGGICVGCTMPGLGDRLVPAAGEPPGTSIVDPASSLFGSAIRGLRPFTNRASGEGPRWRGRGRPVPSGSPGTRAWGVTTRHDAGVDRCSAGRVAGERHAPALVATSRGPG